MIQLQAGYRLDCVKDILKQNFNQIELRGLLVKLSYFDVEISSTAKFDNMAGYEQILSVAYNLISRGLPTRSSLWLESQILQTLNLTELDSRLLEIGTIQQNLKIEDPLKHMLFRALHIIDPELKGSAISRAKMKDFKDLGSQFEEDFLYEQLPKYASPYWVQLLESQREVENVLRYSATLDDEVEKYLNGTIKTFKEQRLDFSCEFPYEINGRRGFVVEIDGSQHEKQPQSWLDEDRDYAIEKALWGRPIRITTRDWSNIGTKINNIRQLEERSYFNLIKQNFNAPLYDQSDGLIALQLTLIPFAVARIQKTILHLFFEGKLNIDAKQLNIAIIERDIPCGSLAIEDLQQWLNALFKLKGAEYQLPVINVYVEGDKRFASTKLQSISNIEKLNNFDLLIDISVLQRSGLSRIVSDIHADTKVLIRSAHSVNSERVFKSADLISYKSFGRSDDKNDKFIEDQQQVAVLETFVQMIFRKTGFRPGQIEIINRALQGKSVIGLLPTGSGKSLTYQLASLLQPGMVIIIDPIKSLMKDQYESLLKNGIDGALFINSSLNRVQKDIAIQKIKHAKVIFSFVSPERLQDDSFRSSLLETQNINEHYFSYCIIDEAHCVSEWGHDFRTSYLRLGENLRNHCFASKDQPAPFFALTATASYDVLSDIQRELGILEEEAVVRLQSLDRPELQFKIIEVSADLKPGDNNVWDTKKLLGSAKQSALIDVINDIPDYFEVFSQETINGPRNKNILIPNFDAQTFYQQSGRDNNAGLIFCPNRKWYFGAIDIANKIMENFVNLKIGTYFASDEDKIRDAENDKNQSLFVNNKLDALVATKAFGMGIDKPNIRFVIHFNYPSSIESYYQEVGRGGRDRKLALGIILFNRQKVLKKRKFADFNGDAGQNGKKENSEESVDKDILLGFHEKNFKGINKEKRLLAELLTEIKFPFISFTKYIEGCIWTELKVEVELRPMVYNDGWTKLYINPDYGNIDLDDKLTFYSGMVPKPDAPKIVAFIRDLIIKEKPADLPTYSWITQFIEAASQPGIEKRLLELQNFGDSTQITIPFSNNAIEKIAQLLSQNGFPFSDRMVNDAQNYCKNSEEFIKNLGKQHKKGKVKGDFLIPETIKPAIEKLFKEIRNDGDTFKAVYRLSIIGVVDDYTVDYNAQIITVSVTKRPKGYYTDQLKKYMLRYNSPEDTDLKIDKLPFSKGNTEIQKCLRALIQFIYGETAIQRQQAIDAMEDACIIGLDKNGNDAFKAYIDMYMNSKYARPQYLPADTNKGLKEDYSIVEKYMNLVGEEKGQVNNFKHLRGAATNLLVGNPKNFVFMLLNSFSVILIEKENNDFIKDALMKFVEGFKRMHEQKEEGVNSIKSKVDSFKQKIGKYDQEAIKKIESAECALYLSLHTVWLRNFNNKFIEEYVG